MAPDGAGPSPIQASDATLDAGAFDDETYLEKLGYRQELRRVIGLFSSFGVQFSAIAIWSSVFTVAIVGLSFFGPASFYSWIIGGFFQVFAVGLAVATLVSAYPLCGGVYQINNRILSQARSPVLRQPWVGWQSGWWIVVAHTVSVTTIGWAIAPFVANWFGIASLSNNQTLVWTLGIVAVVSLINFTGVKVATRVNNIGVIAELAGIAIVVAALLIVRHPTQPVSFLTNTGGKVVHGAWLKPFLFAFLLPAYVISSFDSTGNAAEETHDASKKAAQGVFLANTGAWVFGLITMGLVFISIQNLPAVMTSPLPTKLILDSAIGSGVTQVLQALAIVALIATACIIQLTGARVLWSQARDGQIPAARIVRRVSRTHMPANATWVVIAMSVIFAVVASQSPTALAVLAGLTSLAWALAYGVVVVVGFYGHLTGKLPQRPFTVGRLTSPVFVVAILWSILLITILIWQNPSQVGGGMLGAIAVGAVLYFLVPKNRRGKSAGFAEAEQLAVPSETGSSHLMGHDTGPA